jgi:hypothetical protein
LIDNSVVLPRDKFLSAKVEAAVLIEAWLLSDSIIRQMVSRNHCHLVYVDVTIGIATRGENTYKISFLVSFPEVISESRLDNMSLVLCLW